MEDDLDLAELVIEYLESESIECDVAYNGVMALELIKSNQYDIIILDIMLPRMDGLIFCSTIRKQGNSTPCLMLTARDTLEEKLSGFAHGADDYMVKPFDLRELVARLHALARRQSNPSNVIQVADLLLDVTNRRASRNGRQLSLSPIEWKLLELLMRESPKVVTRFQLETLIWGNEPPSNNALKTQIFRLRQIVDGNNEVQLLHTVRGVGVALRANSAYHR